MLDHYPYIEIQLYGPVLFFILLSIVDLTKTHYDMKGYHYFHFLSHREQIVFIAKKSHV